MFALFIENISFKFNNKLISLVCFIKICNFVDVFGFNIVFIIVIINIDNTYFQKKTKIYKYNLF